MFELLVYIRETRSKIRKLRVMRRYLKRLIRVHDKAITVSQNDLCLAPDWVDYFNAMVAQRELAAKKRTDLGIEIIKIKDKML